MNDNEIPNGLIQALTSASVAILAVNFAFWPIYAPFGPDEPPWELKHLWIVAPILASVATIFLELFFTLNPNNRTAADLRISRILIAVSFALFLFAVIAAFATFERRWNLYIYAGNDGQTYVSAKAPSECVRASNIRHFEVAGGKRPGALMAPLRVEDAEAWLSEHEGKGFSFKAGTISN